MHSADEPQLIINNYTVLGPRLCICLLSKSNHNEIRRTEAIQPNKMNWWIAVVEAFPRNEASLTERSANRKRQLVAHENEALSV